MKLAKLLAATLIGVGGAFGAFAAELKVTDVSKPGKLAKLKIGTTRSTPYKVSKLPEQLKGLPCVYLPRGTGGKPGKNFSFNVNKPVTVYILVHVRGGYAPKGWTKTDLKAQWMVNKGVYKDGVYKKDFPAGKVEIPAHTGTKQKNKPPYGVAHLAVIKVK